MSKSIKAAVISCSSTGFSAEIAKEISRAAEKAGAEVRRGPGVDGASRPGVCLTHDAG